VGNIIKEIERSEMQKHSIAIFITNGSEDTESIVPMDVLKRLNQEVDYISIEPTHRISTARGITIIADKTLDEANLEAYDTYIIPGGQVLDNFESPKADKLKEFYQANFGDQNILFAAICAAPHILNHWGLLEGYKVTNFPGIQIRGGFEDKYTGNRVEISKNLITSIGPGSSFEFAEAIAQRLVGKEATSDILRSMQLKV
jgi:4-methyl-5(b-hydroxyethyl)-thiazole monophosphate biosynthesis